VNRKETQVGRKEIVSGRKALANEETIVVRIIGVGDCHDLNADDTNPVRDDKAHMYGKQV
jgi:hypothetical protein